MTDVRVHVAVDRDRCIGSGNCVYWAPASFELDDEGQSVPSEPAADTLEKLRVAADGCPTRAITVEVVDPGADAAPAAGDDGR
jgi:ferredoxin